MTDCELSNRPPARCRRRLTIQLVVVATVTMAAGHGHGAVDFDHAVVPILRTHCVECHAGEQRKGGLSLNDREGMMAGSEYGPVVVPGDSGASRLLAVISASRDDDDRMPPKGAGLSPAEVAVVRAWIDEGAAWTPGFAFERPAYDPPLKPRRPDLPAATDGRDHPIDRLIDGFLAQHDQPRPPAVDDATFLRRVSLDLIGLLPEPSEAQAFLADRSADKRRRLIDSLLADDIGYAEHWMTFWNDLLRNDYAGTGYIDGGRRQISGWLYDALRTNMPYDQFARALIAPPTDESRGFIAGIKWRGEVSAGQTVEIQFAQSVAQTFLGLNMKCASCHDSFIDRWKLDEAYGLAAVFAERDLEIARCDKGTGKLAQAAWIFPELGQIDPQAPQPERLRQLSSLMTDRENGRFTRTIVNRLWHRLMGRGIVHPVDAMQSEPWHEDLLDFLAEELVDHGYDLRKTLAFIASSQAYQSRAAVVPDENASDPATLASPRAKRLTAEQFVDAIWQLTGTAPAKPDAPVRRGPPPSASDAVGPLAASWIWGDSARDGAVPPAGETITFRRVVTVPAAPVRATAAITCDNAFRLRVNGREIAQSDNWEQVTLVDLSGVLHAGHNTLVIEARNGGSAPNPAGLFFEARLRFPDGSMESVVTNSEWAWEPGPATADSQTSRRATEVPTLAAWGQVIASQAPGLLTDGLTGDRRMVRAVLMKSDMLMRSLGRPNREQIVSMRPNDLTTLEAIDLSNGTILAEALAAGARRLASQPWPDAAALVRHLFLAALSRPPTDVELAALSPALATPPAPQAIEDVLWAICMTPEFQLVR